MIRFLKKLKNAMQREGTILVPPIAQWKYHVFILDSHFKKWYYNTKISAFVLDRKNATEFTYQEYHDFSQGTNKIEIPHSMGYQPFERVNFNVVPTHDK
jgi:hypothetical protein